MYKHYVILACRNLSRKKVYTGINVLGLAIGLACCILILLYVRDEFRYDGFHSKGHRMFRLLRESKMGGSETRFSPRTSGAIALAMVNDYPEVEAATRIINWTHWVGYKEKLFNVYFCLAEATLLSMFDFQMVRGDIRTALEQRGSVLVSERAARLYFGDENPIGKVVTVDSDLLGGDYTITGVLKDMPRYARHRFDFLTSAPPVDAPEYFGDRAWQGWSPTNSWRPVNTYILLAEGYSHEDLKVKLHDFMVRYMGEKIATTNAYHLQPVNRIHLYSSVDYGMRSAGGITYVYQLASIGAFLLLIACINFTNLATARSGRRSREVGIRKVLGGYRRQLFIQFLLESCAYAAIALVIAWQFVELALPEFNDFVGKSLSLEVTDDLLLFIGILLITLVAGLVAGCYPALFLSAFKPAEVLKGSRPTSLRPAWLRRGLVLFQFAATIGLVASTAVVYRQTEYLKGRDMGFNEDLMVNVSIFFPDLSLTKKKEEVKRAFLRHPNVLKATVCWPPPGGGYVERHVVRPEGSGESEWEMQVIGIDEDFLDVYEIELLAGRNLNLSIASDSTEAFILNETAVERLGWTDPIGKELEWRGHRRGRVIGIVKDFHSQSLHHRVDSVVMFYWIHLILSLRIDPEGIPETLSFLEETWESFIPHLPFDFYFVDERVQGSYRSELKLARTVGIFALLAIFVASLGLYGLAAFTTEQRTREIGIRKSLGASVFRIVGMLSRESLTLVGIANLLAWPVTYWVMDAWLTAFPYRVDLEVGVFILSGLLAFVIALGTVSFHASQAARTNPTDALRHE